MEEVKEVVYLRVQEIHVASEQIGQLTEVVNYTVVDSAQLTVRIVGILAVSALENTQ